MERKQFSFYSSFRKAARLIKSKTRRCDFYDMLIDYALSGEMPDQDRLPPDIAMAFELIKPNLDASRRRAQAGQLGGRSRQSASKYQAKPKQSPSEGEKEKEREIENEIENEIELEKEDEEEIEIERENTGSAQEEFAAVLAVYEEKVSRRLSLRARSELLAFVEEMGQECCLRAIDAALDEGKHAWSYIRAILSAKQDQGVRSIADWEQAERQFQQRKGRAAPAPTGMGEEMAAEDMQRTRRLVERLRQDEKGEE